MRLPQVVSSSPQHAPLSRGIRIIVQSLSVASLLLVSAGCATVPKAQPTFPVTLEVDFGPAAKPAEAHQRLGTSSAAGTVPPRSAVRQMVQVERGATPRDATEKLFPVGKGAVCCDPREVATINGVASDPATNRWWTVAVNGSKKGVSPYKTRLKPGDVVRWEYKQYGQ